VKWIEAIEQPQSATRLTKVWGISPKNSALPNFIGTVSWFPAWRCYCFFPNTGSIYEPTCLRDIADFCEEKTQERKTERTGEKE
jgi:hypothetical protein